MISWWYCGRLFDFACFLRVKLAVEIETGVRFVAAVMRGVFYSPG